MHVIGAFRLKMIVCGGSCRGMVTIVVVCTYQDDLCFIKVVLYSHNGVSFLWVLEEHQRHIKNVTTSHLWSSCTQDARTFSEVTAHCTALVQLPHTFSVFNNYQPYVTQLANLMNTFHAT